MFSMFYWVSGSLVGSSVVIGLSASSLFYWWVAMELNLLAFIGWLLNQQESVEFKIKYFIIQSFGSALFFLSLVLVNWSEMFLSFLFISLTWKLGLAPLHFWFVQIVQSVKKNTMLFLFTIQKFLPFLVLLMFMNEIFFWVVGSLSVLVALTGATFQKNWKKMLTYSSIFSGSWLLLTMGENFMFFMFFFIYSLSLLVVLSAMLSMENSLESSTTLNLNESNSLAAMLGLFSMGGVPPFLGFFAKIFILMKSLFMISYYFLVYITISSAYMIYMYIRLFYTTLGSHSLNSPLLLNQLNFSSVSLFLVVGSFLIFMFLRESIITLSFELKNNN